MESSQMQITSDHIPGPRSCASVSSKCHRSLTRSYEKELPVRSHGTNWEKYLDSSSMYQTKYVSEPTTMNSGLERKKHIKDPNRYICSVPAQLTRSTNRGLSNDQSISACSQSSFSDSGSVSCLTPCSGSTGCATGLSTDHSSIYSWRYDEFDKENTQYVRQLFSALDELLYEGKVSSKSETLCNECKDWNMHSPHLRILGNQLESPKQEGIQFVHRRPTSVKMDASPCLKKSDNHELCVEGYRLTSEPCTDKFVYSRLHFAKLSLCHMPQEEEIYEAEGKIEEFLAYDGREMESEVMDQRWSSAASSWDGVPAVSPNTCIIGSVVDELFDDLWSEVVGLLEQLLRKHWEKLHSDATCQRLESSSQTLCDSSAHLPLRSNHISPSKGSNRRSMFLWPNNHVQDSNLFGTNLNGVITIQAKPLQQRQQGHSERSFCDSDDGGTTVTCVKTQRGASALSHKPSHQRIVPRLSSRARLCHSFPAQSTLLGTRLSTVAEDLLPQPLSAVQNHRLPLIHLDCTEQDCSAPASRHKQQLRGRTMRGGAVGAMPAVTSLPPLTESTLLLESLSRPNTTHTFRSETPMKSSFTSMEFAFSMRKGKSFHTGNLSRTGDGIPMGVTGFSVGITSSTANDFQESVTQKRRAHFLCSTDEEGGNIPILGSIGARRTLRRFSGHGRKKLQVAIQHS